MVKRTAVYLFCCFVRTYHLRDNYDALSQMRQTRRPVHRLQQQHPSPSHRSMEMEYVRMNPSLAVGAQGHKHTHIVAFGEASSKFVVAAKTAS